MICPVPLVCPPCRVLGADGLLVVRILDQRGDHLVCPGCGRSYPVVGGVACVPPDLAAFRGAQADALSAGWPHADAVAVDPQAPGWFETALPAQYGLAHHPESPSARSLHDELESNLALFDQVLQWVGATEAAPASEGGGGCLLEAGCGPGGLLHRLPASQQARAVGLDLRLGMVRAAAALARHGQVELPMRVQGAALAPVTIARNDSDPLPIAWIQGDIADPPFVAEQFSVIVALSLLDTVPDPRFALGQLDALLAPGGTLVLGTPYQWQTAVTAPQLWLGGAEVSSEEALRTALRGGDRRLPHLRYDILEERERLAWTLPGDQRVVYRYFLHMVRARKVG
jgi:SAM-dependent methyltransferase/uncharacterized protein YbaR (Trm112 family)